MRILKANQLIQRGQRIIILIWSNYSARFGSRSAQLIPRAPSPDSSIIADPRSRLDRSLRRLWSTRLLLLRLPPTDCVVMFSSSPSASSFKLFGLRAVYLWHLWIGNISVGSPVVSLPQIQPRKWARRRTDHRPMPQSDQPLLYWPV